MKVHAFRSRLAIGAIGLVVASLAAGGVAMASTQGTSAHGTGMAPAVTAPYVFAGYRDGATILPFSPGIAMVGHLWLPAGIYMVTAKLQVHSQAGTGNSAVWCKLSLGSSTDQAQVDAQDGNGLPSRQPVRNGVMTLILSGWVGQTTSLTLQCRNYGGGLTDVRYVKINALKVNGMTKRNF